MGLQLNGSWQRLLRLARGDGKKNVRSLAMRGSVFTIVGYGTSNLLRLGSNILLAHLLFPEAFGLMVLVAVFVQGLAMFSDVGIGPSIIHSTRGEDPRFLNTAWTVQAVRGFVLWGCACAGSAYYADFYEKPELALLIPVAGFAAVLAGFNSTKIFSAARNLALGRKTLNEVSSQLAGALVMISWAQLDRSVWALVAGSLTQVGGLMVLSHVNLPGIKNRFCMDRDSARELFGFGKWVFVSTMVTFFALQIDRLMLGKLVPTDMLGVYGIAVTLATLPQIVGGMLTGTVQYPVLARYAREDPAGLPARVLELRKGLLQSATFALLGVALISPAFFRIAYDYRYAAGEWMTPLMTISAWFLLLQVTADRALLAVGDTRSLALTNLAAFALKVVGCHYGFQGWGVPGFIIGVTLGTLAGHLVVQAALRRHSIRIMRQDLCATGLAFGCGLPAAVLPTTLAPALGFEGLWARSWLELGFALCVLIPLGIAASKSFRAGRVT
ncbi:MAG: O-antigen/teichoic acid export membrane protein [Planctomycetota bacterium]|jgi:O-antigen/teichoic acid export membrane protein